MQKNNWHTFLQDCNAVIDHGEVVHFGDRQAELNHVRSGTILVDLSHYGLIRFSGEDAPTFLQSQLSCDVNEVNTGQAQYGSYCTPKGRVLANFILWQNNDEWIMRLPAHLCASVQKRLSMFVLRSKVNIDNCSEQWVRIGVAGKESCKWVGETLRTSFRACAQLSILHTPQALVLFHSPSRLELITTVEQATRLWEALSVKARPVGGACWRWLEIQAGIATITVATQEQFLPQMINLDIVGGVNFQKGCYPGQEIVARTQYLGKLKRRMYLAHIPVREVVSAGDDLFSKDTPEQSCGKIVNVSPSPGGGYDVLVVVQQSSVVAGEGIYWRRPDGPELKFGQLPYSLDSPSYRDA